MVLLGRVARIVGVLAALVVLASCGSGASLGGESPAGPQGEPRPGGSATFILIQGGQSSTVDPQSLEAYASSAITANAIYGELVVSDPLTGEVSPRITESLTTEDGLTWTLVLRPGLRFSDGTTYDAAAVDYAWGRYADPRVVSEAGRAAVATIKGRTVVDDRTLSIRLEEPNRQFDNLIATSTLNYIGSPTALAKGAAAFAAAPVGAGPFVVSEWIRGDRLVLKRNPDYFEPGKPYLDELILRDVVDAPTRLQSVQSGDADLAMNVNPDLGRQAREVGLSTAEQVNGTQVMQMNTRRAPFDDIRARRAVSLAIDMDALNAAVFGGSGQVAHTQFPEQSPFYQPDPALYVYDRARAQQLFDELAAEGKPVEFTMTTFPSEARRALESIQAQLSTFRNVTAHVEIRDPAAVYVQLGNGAFQATAWGIQGVDPDPELYSTFYSASKRNYTGISDPELDAALIDGRTTADPASRIAAYSTAQARIAELVPYVPYQRYRPQLILGAIGGAGFFGQGAVPTQDLWKTSLDGS